MDDFQPEAGEILEVFTDTGKSFRHIFDGGQQWTDEEAEKLEAFKDFLKEEGLLGKDEEYDAL
jgi:hypothetical protein